MLVYSFFHYLLFRNEKVFCLVFLRSYVSPISTIKQDGESGVVSPLLNGNSRSEHDYEFKHFSGHS